MRYPPFCDIILIGISSNIKEDVEKISNKLYKLLLSKNNLNLMIYKPIPAPIDKIKNRIRWRVIIKCKLNGKIVDMINKNIKNICDEIPNNSKTRIICDINPNNML